MYRNVIVVLLMTLIFGQQNQLQQVLSYFFLNSYFLTYASLQKKKNMSSVTRDSRVKSFVLFVILRISA